METFNQIIDWVQWGLMVGISGAITQWTVCCVIKSPLYRRSLICGAGTAYHSRVHEFNPRFSVDFVLFDHLDFCVMFCRSLFVLFPLAILLSVLRFTASDYLFGILKLFFAGDAFLSRNRISLSRSRSKECLWEKKSTLSIKLATFVNNNSQ